MNRVIKNLVFVVAVIFLNGCLATRQFFVGEEGNNVTNVSIETALHENRLPEHQNISSVRLHRGETSSYHLIQVRKGEPLHVHHDHDLAVVIYHGRGVMQIGTNRFPVSTGDIISVPKEMPHSYRNEMLRPSVAVAIFTPPLDGKDKTLVEEDNK